MKKLIQAGSIVLLTLLTSLLFNISTVKADDSMYLDPDGNLFVNGSVSALNMVPVGGIIAWHKDMDHNLHPEYQAILTEYFMECNGDTITDPDSPFEGEILPDLNSSGRFLRGSDASGTMQDDTTALPDNSFITDTGGNHRHYLFVNTRRDVMGGDIGSYPTRYVVRQSTPGGNSDYGINSSTSGTPNCGYGGYSGNHNHTITTGGDSETRPINMSVVWIMRIK